MKRIFLGILFICFVLLVVSGGKVFAQELADKNEFSQLEHKSLNRLQENLAVQLDQATLLLNQAVAELHSADTNLKEESIQDIIKTLEELISDLNSLPEEITVNTAGPDLQ